MDQHLTLLHLNNVHIILTFITKIVPWRSCYELLVAVSLIKVFSKRPGWFAKEATTVVRDTCPVHIWLVIKGSPNHFAISKKNQWQINCLLPNFPGCGGAIPLQALLKTTDNDSSAENRRIRDDEEQLIKHGKHRLAQYRIFFFLWCATCILFFLTNPHSLPLVVIWDGLCKRKRA